jgi:hypothetical protein
VSGWALQQEGIYHAKAQREEGDVGLTEQGKREAVLEELRSAHTAEGIQNLPPSSLSGFVPLRDKPFYRHQPNGQRQFFNRHPLRSSR